MSTNLRLRPEAEAAVRAEAHRSGRSQQEIIREAVDRYLALSPTASTPASDRDAVVASGAARPPRTPYRRARRRLRLPGITTAELLDRSDRM